jgi:hypothetical protein
LLAQHIAQVRAQHGPISAASRLGHLNQAVHGGPALREFFGGFMNPAHRQNTFSLIRYSGERRWRSDRVDLDREAQRTAL